MDPVVPLAVAASFPAQDASTLTITDIRAVDAGNYRCTVSSSCGQTRSNPIRVDVSCRADLTKMDTRTVLTLTPS